MNYNTLEDKDFINLISTSSDYYVIMFGASWCGPCQIMKPVYDELATSHKYQKLVKFVYLDRDTTRHYNQDYGFEIPTIPRFFLVKFEANGIFSHFNIKISFGGSQSLDSFNQKLDDYFSISNPQKNANTTESPNIDFSEITNTLTNMNTITHKKPTVAIIGSGPSGLTAAIYTARAELETTIYTGLEPGGQLTTTTEIENFPGAWDATTKAGMMGPDLMQLMQKQAEHFGAKSVLTEIRGIEIDDKAETKFTLDIGGKKEKFDAVIIASGASAKYLGIAGEEKFVGKGYHTCATCDGFFYRGKIIAVIGGGDSAMEEANFLTKFAEKVYLIHRREEFRASKIMLERARENPKIEFVLNKAPIDFMGDEEVTGLVLKDSITSQTSELNLDGVFVAIGHIPNTGFVKGQLSMDETGYLIPQAKRPPEERTSHYGTMSEIPGIFIAGDVEDKTYRQAITAAGGGCKAAMDTEKWLADQE